MKKAILYAFLLIAPTANSAFAQDDGQVERVMAVLDNGTKPKKDRPIDGAFVKKGFEEAKPIALPAIREQDVFFSKRVWRDIDVRDKMNAYMDAPKSRLMDIFMNAIKNEELAVYSARETKEDPNGDEFSTPMTFDEAIKDLMGDGAQSWVITKRDEDGNPIDSALADNEFRPEDIKRFRIKEDWVFDKQRSVFENRIIGIAPLIQRTFAGIQSDVFQPAFWIYFPEARQILATKEVMNNKNDATGISYDDVFLRRFYNSYIVKESNVKDEYITNYKKGIDRLYESERIKNDLIDYEQNLWEY